jgi:hypothetical protein
MTGLKPLSLRNILGKPGRKSHEKERQKGIFSLPQEIQVENPNSRIASKHPHG